MATSPTAFTGVVCLFHPERKRPGPRGVQVLELLASLAGLAVERAARARDALRSAASDSAHERWVDPLTQLPGRQLFERMLRDLIGASDPDSTRFALLLIDVDRFLDINERYGSRLGDILLASFARRMQKALRRGDLAARLEGDCFALLVRMGDDADEASRLAGRFREEGRRSFEFDGQAIALTVSVGVGVYPWDGSQGAMLLANAEVALRAARAAGGDGFRIYSASLRAEPSPGPGASAAATSPASAPKLDELELLWEPCFEVSSRRWIGLTARLALEAPGRGARRRRRSLAGGLPRRHGAGHPALVRAQRARRLRARDPRSADAGAALDPGRGAGARHRGLRRHGGRAAGGGAPGAGGGRRSRSRCRCWSATPPAPWRPACAALAGERLRLELSGVGSGNLPLEALTEIAWSGWKLDALPGAHGAARVRRWERSPPASSPWRGR